MSFAFQIGDVVRVGNVTEFEIVSFSDHGARAHGSCAHGSCDSYAICDLELVHREPGVGQTWHAIDRDADFTRIEIIATDVRSRHPIVGILVAENGAEEVTTHSRDEFLRLYTPMAPSRAMVRYLSIAAFGSQDEEANLTFRHYPTLGQARLNHEAGWGPRTRGIGIAKATILDERLVGIEIVR